MRPAYFAALALVVIVGVIWFGSGFHHIGTPPDPNDPDQSGLMTPEVVRHIVSGYSDALLTRMPRDEAGNVNDADFKRNLAQATNSLLAKVKMIRMNQTNAWEYGDIFITAQRWQDARNAEEEAIKSPKNEDRRINDTLRLARCMAELGDVPDAVKTARSTFNAADTDTVPVLTATLLEIVPAAEDKGDPLELAELLEGAIQCEMRTRVNGTTDAGRDFLVARKYHVDHAWQKIIQLYERAGKTDLARAALKRAMEMERTEGAA